MRDSTSLFSVETLERIYWALERRLAPGLRYSQSVYEDALAAAVTTRTRWLDIGCGHQVLPLWRHEAEIDIVARAAEAIGLDPDREAIGKHRTMQVMVGSAETLPFPDDRFDLITANMVVEHLADPVAVMREVHRVLAPGGRFLFHTPNTAGYVTAINRFLPGGLKRIAARLLDGRNEEDVYPTHYRCNDATVIGTMAAEAGMHIDSLRHIPTTAVFARVFPIAAIELIWIRLTMRDAMSPYRTNLLVSLRKPESKDVDR